MRTNYQVELPRSKQASLQSIVRDDTYPQAAVDTFVDNLKREQMKFYDDTTATLLESNYCVKWEIKDPSEGKAPLTLWQCASCKQPCTYHGLERGHRTDWKLELKKAGVKNTVEATIVYNNLLNLQTECRACNASHAFEKDGENHFKDLPTKDDFRSGKAGEQAHAKLLDSYVGMDVDEYESDDSFIDNSDYKSVTLVLMESIHLTDEGGMNAGVSKLFGKTLVCVTNSKRGRWIKVLIIETLDDNLKNCEETYLWTLARKLKEGKITTY